VTNDWKFAAAVVDRFLLWFFALATGLCSVMILLAAPTLSSASRAQPVVGQEGIIIDPDNSSIRVTMDWVLCICLALVTKIF